MTNNKSSGLGIIGVIQIVFIILKLCKVITWSWWLVLIPLWIDLGLTLIFLIIYAIVESHDNKKYFSNRNGAHRCNKINWKI